MDVTSLLSSRIHNRYQNLIQDLGNDSVSYQDALRAHMDMHQETLGLRVTSNKTIQPFRGVQFISPESSTETAKVSQTISQEQTQTEAVRSQKKADFSNEYATLADEIKIETDKIAASNVRQGLRYDFAKQRANLSVYIEQHSVSIEQHSVEIERISAKIERYLENEKLGATASEAQKYTYRTSHTDIDIEGLQIVILDEQGNEQLILVTDLPAQNHIEGESLAFWKEEIAWNKEEIAWNKKEKAKLIASRTDLFEEERKYDAHMRVLAQADAAHPERASKASPEKPGFLIEFDSIVTTLRLIKVKSSYLEGNRLDSTFEMLKNLRAQWEEWKVEQGYSDTEPSVAKGHAASVTNAYEQARQVASGDVSWDKGYYVHGDYSTFHDGLMDKLRQPYNEAARHYLEDYAEKNWSQWEAGARELDISLGVHHGVTLLKTTDHFYERPRETGIDVGRGVPQSQAEKIFRYLNGNNAGEIATFEKHMTPYQKQMEDQMTDYVSTMLEATYADIKKFAPYLKDMEKAGITPDDVTSARLVRHEDGYRAEERYKNRKAEAIATFINSHPGLRDLYDQGGTPWKGSWWKGGPTGFR